eukprot:11214265-Lingulodinium_polyedra.AAC.1
MRQGAVGNTPLSRRALRASGQEPPHARGGVDKGRVALSRHSRPSSESHCLALAVSWSQLRNLPRH